MPALNKMSRTDISAIVSVLLFSMTILVTAVVPAQAGDASADAETSSPAVSFVNLGYPA